MSYVGYPGGIKVIRFGSGKGYFRIPSIRAPGALTVFTLSRRYVGMRTGKFGRVLSCYDGKTRAYDSPADWVSPSWCLAVMDEKPYEARIDMTRPRRWTGCMWE